VLEVDCSLTVFIDLLCHFNELDELYLVGLTEYQSTEWLELCLSSSSLILGWHRKSGETFLRKSGETLTPNPGDRDRVLERKRALTLIPKPQTLNP
jgi:hypothetical protein